MISNIVFDSHPIEQTLEQIRGAVIFSVFDMNSAYYQIPLCATSRRVTNLYTCFGLFEFNKLPMGIRVRSQWLSKVVDELFVYIKGHFVFKFLDDLVLYSSFPEEHALHVREVLSRLQISVHFDLRQVCFGCFGNQIFRAPASG